MNIDSAYQHRLWWLLLLAFLISGTQSAVAVTRIHPGNVINFTVSGHSEFSGKFTVLQNGTVEYPLLAGIPLNGLTPDDLKDLLRSVLLRFEMEPEIFVIISEQKILKFQAFGEIRHPGSYEIEGTLNLQQALSMVGGPTEYADYRHIRILRYEDDKRLDLDIDLKNYFKQDSLILPPDIQDGDIIIVPYQTIDYNVRILGEVNAPGFYFIDEEDDLMDVIQKAGGFGSNSDIKRIMHITNISGQYSKSIINVRKIIQSGQYQTLPRVNYGDVIIVPRREEWRSFWTWMSKWRDVILFATSILILDKYLNQRN